MVSAKVPAAASSTRPQGMRFTGTVAVGAAPTWAEVLAEVLPEVLV
jgi:hypothetical protein